MIPFELIHALPKTDLHCHLDGSLRIETLWELARENRVDLGTRDVAGLREKLKPRAADLASYIRIFESTLAVLQDAASLRRVAYELVEDASRENVRYLEVRYSPILHVRRGLALETIVEAVLEGLAAGERDFGLPSGVILCGIRTISPETSLLLADLTVSFKDRGVVAFDLAGEEKDYPAKAHLAAFYKILNNNINVTVHAGEGFGPASIHQALHYCNAHRVGHGTRLREDPELLEYVNDHRIPLEMCISSNLHTGSIASTEDHPFRQYFDRGLRVTLNTDNRLISDTTASKEIEIACRTFDLTIYDLRRLLIHGLSLIHI
ncbi:MAG: adenosine deaminase [Candidatus Eisenbacteria bacterium]|nr:adenosine deaminase [Candidatus Eisenbacteria bacterium]